MSRCMISAVVLGMILGAEVSAQPASVPSVRQHILGIGVEPTPIRTYDLLKREAVQAEIKPTLDQVKKWEEGLIGLKPLEDRIRESADRIRRSRGLANDDPRKKPLIDEGRNLQSVYFSQKESLLATVLDPDQMARLRQIELQAQGFLAFRRPDVQERLKLSPDQIAALSPIIEQGLSDVERASRLPSRVFRKARERVIGKALGRRGGERLDPKQEVDVTLEQVRGAVLASRAATMDAITRVLTEDQRATYQAMLGKSFDFSPMLPKPRP